MSPQGLIEALQVLREHTDQSRMPHHPNAVDRAIDVVCEVAPVLLKACRQAIGAIKGREHDGFLRDAIAKAERHNATRTIPQEPISQSEWDAFDD